MGEVHALDQRNRFGPGLNLTTFRYFGSPPGISSRACLTAWRCSALAAPGSRHLGRDFLGRVRCFPRALPPSSLIGSVIVNVAAIVLLGVLGLPNRP